MTLLFVHGAGGGGEVWRFQTEYFRGSVAVDLPGHPGGQGFNTVGEYAKWVRQYVVDRGLSPAILVGHSMGGAVSQWLALDSPEILQALVLVSTGARLRVAPQTFEVLKGDYEQAVDYMLGNTFGPRTPPELLEEAKRLRMRVSPDVVRGDYEACDKFDIMDRIGNISLPTLIICGSEDRTTPIKYSEYLLSHIPGSLLQEIPGAGHNVMQEKPADFNKALETFVKSLEKREE